MPFTRPARGTWPPPAPDTPAPTTDTATLNALEHELLSLLAQHAVLTGDEDAPRAVVPHGRLELWETQFLAPVRDAAASEAQGHIKRHEIEAYERTKGKEAARRRLLEEEAAERGHISSRILTYRGLQKLTSPTDLVPNVIYSGSVGVIGGDSQVGKSWVMLSIAWAAAAGIAWPIGSRPDAPRPAPIPVLYVAAEDGGHIKKRLLDWEAATGQSLDDESGHIFHTYPGAVNLLDEVAIDEVCDVVRRTGYRLVVFDTVAACLGGEEEGNPQFSRVVQHMRKIVAAMNGQGSAFLVHHTGKDASKGLRGGSALFNDSDIVWILDGDIGAITMKNRKWKIDEERRPWRLRLSKGEGEPTYLRRDDSPASISVAAPGDRYAALKVKVLHIITVRTDPRTAIGPTRQLIHGDLKGAGVQFRESELTPVLEQLVADGLIVGCTPAATGQRGRPAKYCYRPAPTQPELPSA